MKKNCNNPKLRESIPWTPPFPPWIRWTRLEEQIVPIWNDYVPNSISEDLNSAFNKINEDIIFNIFDNFNVGMTWQPTIKVDNNTLASAVLKAGVEIFVKAKPNTLMTGEWKMMLMHYDQRKPQS